MEYRKLPHGEEEISVIGIGTSSIGQSGEKEIEATANLALEKGINYFDLASADAAPFAPFGRAVRGCRKDVYFQLHFGADYAGGKYGWSLDPDTIRRSVDLQLQALQTDYIDFAFIHCLDTMADVDKYIAAGILDHIQSLKAQGVVRHIGLSSHTPAVVHRVLDMGILDMLMFSINPAYDYSHGSYGIGSVGERMSLYRRCEKEGVGISVMKPFSGGQLLQDNTSPFKKALTRTQCIQYALDKPGVLTVLPGVRHREDLLDVLQYTRSSAEDRDYSILGTFAPQSAAGTCVYCSHCQPCPAGLDVALINKYYDLSLAGDTLAKGHYQKLPKKAGACIGCGHCNSRCPFHVDQAARMQEIARYFGE